MIYAVTIHIEKEVEKKWVRWMQDAHIPNVLKTGLFLGCRMMRSQITHHNGFTTYRMQYVLENKEKFETYQSEHAQKLQSEANEFFEGRFRAERDILDVIREC